MSQKTNEPTKMLELRAPTISESIESAQIVPLIEYHLTSCKKVKFTRDFATSFLALPSFKAERPIRDSHVEYLIKTAKRGDFHPEWVKLASAVCRYDGVERRLNGQHTCWMRQYMPEDWEITVEQLRYEVDTEDDFRRLYSAFDRGAPRTSAHIINARLYGTEDFEGFSREELSLIVKGFAAYTSPNSKDRNNPDAIADLMSSEWLKTTKLVQRVIAACQVWHGGNGAHLRRAGIVGAMFMTVQKNFEQSLEFWTKVADGVGATSKEDPPFKLRDFILKNPHARELNRTTIRTTVQITKEDILRLCVSTWNHWRKGEPMKQVRFAENRPLAR